jgi:hypothetical protein
MKFRQVAMWGIFWSSAAALSTGALVYAFNPQPDPPGHYYGIMTLPPGQELSLHVSNVRASVSDSRRPADSMCTAELQFVGERGEVLARMADRVLPTESLSLNFTLPAADPPDPDMPGECRVACTDNPPEPMKVRAQVVFTGQAGHCVSSLEVGDPFGDPPGSADPPGVRGGGFIHPGLIVGFNPQPDPPGVTKK